MKKVFGYVMVVVSIILALFAFISLPSLFATFSELLELISGDYDSGDVGYVIGWISWWLLSLAVIVILWVFGRKWIREN